MRVYRVWRDEGYLRDTLLLLQELQVGAGACKVILQLLALACIHVCVAHAAVECVFACQHVRVFVEAAVSMSNMFSSTISTYCCVQSMWPPYCGCCCGWPRARPIPPSPGFQQASCCPTHCAVSSAVLWLQVSHVLPQTPPRPDSLSRLGGHRPLLHKTVALARGAECIAAVGEDFVADMPHNAVNQMQFW